MKKISMLLVLISVFTFSVVNAQKIKIQSAYNYLKRGQLDKAKADIDAATEDPITKEMSKTWFYRGNIYLSVYLQTQIGPGNTKIGMTKKEVDSLAGKPETINETVYKDIKCEQWIYSDNNLYFDENNKLIAWQITKGVDYSNLDSNSLEQAYKAYSKAIELEPDIQNIDLNPPAAKMGMLVVGEQYFNKGAELYNKKLYKEAIEHFEVTIKINGDFMIQDTVATYYAALSANKAKMYDVSKKYFERLLKSNCNKPEIFLFLSDIYKIEKDTVKAINILKKGSERFPDNYDILIYETNIYLAQGLIDKAQENLKKAIEKNPNDPNLYYVIGTKYNDQLNDETFANKKEIYERNYLEAEKNYMKAIELKPDFFDAYYNLGALYVNRAAVTLLVAGKMYEDPNDPRYPVEKKKADEFLEKALPNLEKAHQIDPTDKSTMSTLKELYARTGKMDKANEMNQKLKGK